MNMAEKLIALRKCRGWSQEDLAEQLDVSRQSVSKWESGTSLPDLDRVLNLSRLFGVSTDYLLRDDLEQETAAAPAPVEAPAASSEAVRSVGEEEAKTYLSLVEQVSPRIARAVALCILSPVPLLLLSGLAESVNPPAIRENVAACVGIVALLILVAVAVKTFITDGLRLSPYEYLEKEEIHLSPALRRSVEERLNDFRPTFSSGLSFGVILCIVAVVPLLVAGCLEAPDVVLVSCLCLLLVLVAPAVRRIVHVSMIQGSYYKLLQLEDYTPENKRTVPFGGAYWCIVTAIYLAASFYTEAWNRTWIIWPSAGVLFAGLYVLVRAMQKRKL